jgi:hypothetical protein
MQRERVAEAPGGEGGRGERGRGAEAADSLVFCQEY